MDAAANESDTCISQSKGLKFLAWVKTKAFAGRGLAL